MTDEDLSRLENLPLIPVDLSKVPVILTRLRKPSKVVVRRLVNDYLEKNLSDVLKNLGVIVMEDCPAFWNHNLGVLNTFVHPPTVHGVLKAIAISSTEKGNGMLSAMMLDNVTNDGRRSLRNFISKASSLDGQEKALLLCLPLFQTVNNSEDFVSKKEGFHAAPEKAHEFPVTPQGKFIDIKDEDSRKMVGLLDITILTPTAFLLDGIFPGVKDRKYPEEDIDQLMAFVMKRYHVYVSASPTFEDAMKALPFVPTLSGRVRTMELFDPTKDLIRRLFADEDVFPTGTQYTDLSVLAVLRKLGMRSEDEINAQDLYQSARKISEITSAPTAEQKQKQKQKSEALFAYLEREPRKLQEHVSGKALGELLREIPWVCGTKTKPENYPRSLHFWGEAKGEISFLQPKEVTSKENVNLIGTVRPIIEVESSSQLARYFGWDKKPRGLEVVKHLSVITGCYTRDEKPRYMLVVKDTYSFLCRNVDDAEVAKALREIQHSRWIWNGDGFSAPSSILAEKPSLDLTPYITCLPPEMKEYHDLFLAFGMEAGCDASVLLQVLSLIKEKYEKRKPPFETADMEKDLQLSITILNKLKSSDGPLSPQLQEKVLIPTQVEGDSFVRLVPVEECVYCDREWLQMEKDDEEVTYFFIHPDVSNSTAEFFNVRPLSNSMLDPDELDVGEEFGQEEKLTRRLNRLLEDYKDGFAVPKELIQNADDAGATEVRFLYDERTNEDAMTCLIDEGMRECQGAALWVYNDAEFRNEDFENLTKLSGATKEHDTEKIGKFGLGFNAVYNLTDVPMLVSRNYFVIFDPNTSYLGKAIRNKNKPGVKIDTNKNVKKLRKFSNQFKPFNGIFDCDLHLDKEDNSFHGTLFRFPLRTKEQAIRSEINSLPYDCKQVKDLLMLFIGGARSLLLFTQNVLRVSIFHLPKETTENPQPNMIFDVTKKLAKDAVLRELSTPFNLSTASKELSPVDQFLLKQCNFLRASSEAVKCAEDTRNSSTVFLRSAITLDVKSTVTVDGSRFFGDEVHLPSGTERWLVASSMGSGEAMQFSKQDKSLLPSGGVAVQLTLNNDSISVPVCRSNPSGSAFCYLPLPIHTGLPLHVNGAFAVSSNRRSLKDKTEDDKACIGADWNNVLLKDSVCAAYLDLINDVKPATQAPGGTYQFHSLWPRSCEVEKACEPLARSFYERLVDESLPLFPHGNSWVGVREVVFLHPMFRMDTEIGDIAFEVFRLLLSSNKVVIDLPADIYESFVSFDLETAIQSGNFDKNRFFRELFFPNVVSVPPQLRDRLVLYALDNKNGEFDDMIKTYACIPASPHGYSLKFPTQLVSPEREAGLLFSSEDARFPHGNDDTFLKPIRLLKLEQLGMLTDDLSWPEVAERAESVSILSRDHSDEAIQRTKHLIDFLKKKLKREGQSLPSIEIRTRISEAKFLPVLGKPQNFPLTWKGSEIQGENQQVLISSVEGFLTDQLYLVCCTEPIIDLSIPPKVEEFLNLNRNKATVKHVIAQLNEAVSTGLANADEEMVRTVCSSSYRFLQDALGDNKAEIIDFLKTKNLILVRDEFLCANQIAFKLDADCSPYLYKIPDDLARRYSTLMKAAGVRDSFGPQDYISALERIKQEFQGRKLDKPNVQIAVNLATQLEESLKQSKFAIATAEKRAWIFLPSCNGIMQPVKELCFQDCDWIPGDTGVQFVNSKIPRSTAATLGVKTRREEALRRHAFGISFGQKEKLTNRLKRILKAYPCGKELLKELLQNADDAQATEICFIKDPRNHPKKRLFETCWEPLQGPALCVYNNKPFTNADIEGIQNLGEGSKENDPNKTGQYGVGFNAVYHLTDVPSFMSQGEEIGEVLCVFDPNCQYVPDANPQEPGRMYTRTTELKHTFPDVFSCYLDEDFPIENSTMFRFPLRTKEMADASKISQTPITLEIVSEMMEALKSELFEVLLFVNNVKKITLCEIDDTGKVVNSYSVKAVMSDQDEIKRREFASYTKQVGKLVKEGEHLLSSIERKHCSYVMTLNDNTGNEENWFVVQQFGFENGVAKSIVNAFRSHDLGMLPSGGVACLLSKKSKGREPVERKKKAYCFLPLPIKTDLPVHINGHFALDHEARRNLWKDETGGYRTDWNNALLSDVIASCYLRLLDEVRSYYQLPVLQGTEPEHSSCFEQELVKRVEDYEKLFPQVLGTDSYWNTLVRSVYQGMNKKQMRLLPVLRRAPRGSACSHEANLSWLPPTGLEKDQAFFNNLETDLKISLSEILIETGFNLVTFSLSVFRALYQCGVYSCCVSPSSVMEFLKTFKSEDPLCSIGSIPANVHDTPFKSDDGVSLVLSYCKRQKEFVKNLPGLPLLLTQDNVLRVFDRTDRKFLSAYHDILPQCKEMFVHEKLRTNIFNDAVSQAPVFKPFDVNAFATSLPRTLPLLYYQNGDYVKWFPDNVTAQEPTPYWIFRVWNFLAEIAKPFLSFHPENQNSSYIRGILAPLSNWSILPAKEKNEVQEGSGFDDSSQDTVHFLVPLDLAESVLDFTQWDIIRRPLVEALRKVGLPELNTSVLCSSFTSSVHMGALWEPQAVAKYVVGSLANPGSLLLSLRRRMKTRPYSLQGALDPSSCRTVLQYFNENVSSLKFISSGKDTLRKLPFYLATHGSLVSLENQRICLLPSGIPRVEISSLEREVNVLFLEDMQGLSRLYEFLEFDSISPIDVYCKFICPHFKVFSRETKQTHLKYIRDCILRSTSTNDEERMVDCLRNTEVITTGDGTLQKASCFYDPLNNVFKAMLSEDKFPPEPFNSEQWLPFMKKMGMVHKVSCDHFKKFASEVADEAVRQRTKETDNKSKVLVSHLFSRLHVLNECLLEAVCGIRFVVSDPVRDDLRRLHAQYGENEEGHAPYISFKDSVILEHAETVWTTAHLLPQWADPRSSFSTRVPFGSPLSHLGVLSQPTTDLVTSHCLKISHHLAKQNNTRGSEDQSVARKLVMKKIYSFLQENGTTGSDVKGRLQNVPCILVEQGTRYVPAQQVVLELHEKDEISPFLYRVLPEFGEFHELFQSLGSSKSVKSSHYAMVLEMLHDQSKENKLHPNEIQSSLRAVRGFFECLQQDSAEEVDFTKLYLPALCVFSRSASVTQPVTLHKSTDLIFDDAPQYQSRLQNFNEPFVVDLKRAELQCNSCMNYKDYIMLLSTDCRPQMLSDVVEEKFVHSPDSIDGVGLAVRFNVADSLKKQLCSEQFFHGILRLIRHANRESGNLDDNVIASVEDRLKNIEFLGMKKIETQLMYKGDLIPGSEAEVPHFVDKVSKTDKIVWKVYVNADSEETLSKVSLVLTQVIAEACKGLLRETAMFIPEMLRTDPTNIWSILDDMKIRQDDSYDASRNNVLPQPGNFIPIEDHHLLNEAFEEFSPGEYVGLELDDPSLDQESGDATFVYAVIIEDTNKEDASLYTKLYKVNVGHDKPLQDAESADLYKFHRLQSSSLGLRDQHRSSTLTEEKTKILAQVTEALEMAWSLPEKRRRKIIKRLFLQWHPEKNLQDGEFYREVFQHLQNEVARLERSEAQARSQSADSNSTTSLKAFFGFWETRARQHHAQRQEYRTSYMQTFGDCDDSTSSGSRPCIPPSFCKKNPQPGEARRWFRQAKLDLKAASKDVAADNPSYEWACFKCHQVGGLKG